MQVTPQKIPRRSFGLTTYDAVLYDVWMEERVNAWRLRFWSGIYRIRSLGKFLADFLRLRLSILAFRQDIAGMEFEDAEKKFRELRDEGHKLIASAPPVALTQKRREKIQKELDSILKTET
jgi:hypothetical protein